MYYVFVFQITEIVATTLTRDIEYFDCFISGRPPIKIRQMLQQC